MKTITLATLQELVNNLFPDNDDVLSCHSDDDYEEHSTCANHDEENKDTKMKSLSTLQRQSTDIWDFIQGQSRQKQNHRCDYHSH